MSRSLALFPLNLVVYPEEFLNLHIFEPRYISLISDCLKANSTFGIPSYVLSKIELGTEMEIMGVEKIYSDGRMDIKTKGTNIFEVSKFENPWKEKPYAGGDIKYVKNDITVSAETQAQMTGLALDFFTQINTVNDVHLGIHTTAFDLGHKIGLTREEEYALLKIESEDKRANFVINHLTKMIESMKRANDAKHIIMMNGHFKNLDPLNF